MHARSTRSRLVLAITLAAFALAAAACETVKGAGKDLQNAGEAGQRAIDNATK